MRNLCLMVLCLSLAGCASSRWQVVPAENGAVLLDQTTGETWSRSFYQRPGESFVTPYWREMKRGVAATQPDGGV
jgi:hypothetical protein